MCGIALSIGPEADPATFRRMLAVRAPRGEITTPGTWSARRGGTPPRFRRLVGPRRTRGGDEAALPG